MNRICGTCKYAMFEKSKSKYDAKICTGMKCLLSGEWVSYYRNCRLIFEIVRHGNWYIERKFLGIEECVCTLCKKKSFMLKGKHKDFCPNCGAQMDETFFGVNVAMVNSDRDRELFEDITGLKLKEDFWDEQNECSKDEH